MRENAPLWGYDVINALTYINLYTGPKEDNILCKYRHVWAQTNALLDLMTISLVRAYLVAPILSTKASNAPTHTFSPSHNSHRFRIAYYRELSLQSFPFPLLYHITISIDAIHMLSDLQ